MGLNLDANDSIGDESIGEGQPLPPAHDLFPTVLVAKGLSKFYHEQGGRLRRFFRSRGAALNADDLVQETFVRLAGVTSRKREPIEQPRAYLNHIAKNLLREQARFAARRSAALHVNIEGVNLSGPDPVAQLEARDMLERLEAAMSKMKPATREIFMAHRMDGYTYSEIAGRTGLSIKVVEKHISKAILIVNRAMRNS